MAARSSATTEARRVVVVSYRLGGADGVSTEAAKWVSALRRLGCLVSTLAGQGIADWLDPGLAPGSYVTGAHPPLPDEARVASILARADLVVVENLGSLPLNPPATDVVARALKGRPAIFRHHDLPWQRAAFEGAPPPRDDPAWCHVVINGHSRLELAQRGIDAVVVRNAFDPYPRPGNRDGARAALGVARGERLIVQPTRAIARKGIPRAIALAEAVGAHYWLVGPAEEGYGPVVTALLAAAKVPVRWGPLPGLVTARSGIEHAYAAADLIAFPSEREGFGNPPVEASLHLRPVAVGHYQVAAELRRLGFSWLDADDLPAVRHALEHGLGPAVLQANASVARRHLNLADLPGQLARLMTALGLKPPRAAA